MEKFISFADIKKTIKPFKVKKVYLFNDIKIVSQSNRKWKFTYDNYNLICNCPGGKETAMKIANAISASILRNKNKNNVVIDGLARNYISRLTTII